MKLFGLVLAQAGLTVQHDIHFDDRHEYLEIAFLDKWNQLAHKFFGLHQTDLRRSFFRKWAGTAKPGTNDFHNGRFEREIKKLETNFLRKCSEKDTIPRQIIEDADEDSDDEHENSELRDRRSARGKLQIARNPGHRMKHIVRNVKKWTKEYLTGCPNQEKVIRRWRKFAEKWEKEIVRTPVLQEEFIKEEKHLRTFTDVRPCGRIFTKWGLRGQWMELWDSSLDEQYGYGNLGYTDFGNDRIMSMQPYPGCYIRAYQHVNKEGYSSICDDDAGCPVAVSKDRGVLTPNTASSVYCYCDSPKPKRCGAIFTDDDERMYKWGWAQLWDGATLGKYWSLNDKPVFVKNDHLSAIHTYQGCAITIHEHDRAHGDEFTCPGGPFKNGYWCHHNSLGRVGNDEATTITCTCPVEFDRIEYDDPKGFGDLEMESSGIKIDEHIVENPCPYEEKMWPLLCSKQTYSTSEAITKVTQHSWGRMIKNGVTFTGSAGFKVPGVGKFSATVAYNHEETQSYGGSYSDSVTITNNKICSAMPGTTVRCLYMAYRGKIEMGYTIFWKNASPTRGKYYGEGWKSKLIATTRRLNSYKKVTEVSDWQDAVSENAEIGN